MPMRNLATILLLIAFAITGYGLFVNWVATGFASDPGTKPLAKRRVAPVSWILLFATNLLLGLIRWGETGTTVAGLVSAAAIAIIVLSIADYRKSFRLLDSKPSGEQSGPTHENSPPKF